MQAAPRRYEFLDGLRALAALVVLAHHAQLEVWTEPARSHYFGRMSVDVFIVLSGFCLMIPALRQGVRLANGTLDFFARRARRILPPYYGALALSLFLIWLFIGAKTGTHWDVSLPVTFHGVLANVFLIQDVVHRYEINHAFWSIAVEWQIYFLFPVLLFVWRRLGAFPTAALTVASSLMLLVLLRSTMLAEVTVHFIGLFSLGMLGATLSFSTDAELARVRQIVPWRLITAVLALGVAALVALGWSAHISSPRSAVLDTIVGLTTMTLLLTMMERPDGLAHRLLSARPLARIGTFSYSLYLVHAPLLHMVWLYAVRPLRLSPRATFGVLVLGGGPVIVGAACLFFLVLERPFLTRKAAPPVSPDVAVSRMRGVC